MKWRWQNRSSHFLVLLAEHLFKDSLGPIQKYEVETVCSSPSFSLLNVLSLLLPVFPCFLSPVPRDFMFESLSLGVYFDFARSEGF